uniref:60S ribosomal protein L44-like n=1 Tax=Rhizophora mucronata TaxID=61149 RepID=A0A2P2L504_RHIMU
MRRPSASQFHGISNFYQFSNRENIEFAQNTLIISHKFIPNLSLQLHVSPTHMNIIRLIFSQFLSMEMLLNETQSLQILHTGITSPLKLHYKLAMATKKPNSLRA